MIINAVPRFYNFCSHTCIYNLEVLTNQTFKTLHSKNCTSTYQIYCILTTTYRYEATESGGSSNLASFFKVWKKYFFFWLRLNAIIQGSVIWIFISITYICIFFKYQGCVGEYNKCTGLNKQKIQQVKSDIYYALIARFCRIVRTCT